MKSKIRKIMAILLAASFVVSLAAVAASAEPQIVCTKKCGSVTTEVYSESEVKESAQNCIGSKPSCSHGSQPTCIKGQWVCPPERGFGAKPKCHDGKHLVWDHGHWRCVHG
jgi:hypothetical protein